jgi:hypothetical protein
MLARPNTKTVKHTIEEPTIIASGHVLIEDLLSKEMSLAIVFAKVA